MTSGLSIRGYARHRGVDEKAVRKALATGRIAKAADGTIDPAAADAAWAANTDPARAPSPRPTPRVTPPRSSAHPSPDETADQYARARAANEALKARERGMALAEREAGLVDREQAERLFGQIQQRMAAAWRAWAPRAAVELAQRLDVDPEQTRAAVERAVDRQLAELPPRPFDLHRFH